MKLIQKLCLDGCCDAAIELYQQIFQCEVRSLLHYRDAVKNGWEPECPEKDAYVYHCELMFGEQEMRCDDISGEEKVELTRKTEHLIGMDTAEAVESAFALLSEGGEILRPLKRPPYMVVIGTVKDRFGVIWTLMCDF